MIDDLVYRVIKPIANAIGNLIGNAIDNNKQDTKKTTKPIFSYIPTNPVCKEIPEKSKKVIYKKTIKSNVNISLVFWPIPRFSITRTYSEKQLWL